MRKAVVLTLGGVGTAIALGFGGVMATAAWTGGKVLKQLDEQTNQLVKTFPSISVADQSLVRGPFSSTRDLKLQLGCLPPGAQQAALGGTGKQEPMQLMWRDVVHHGPLPGGVGIAFATIDSELISPPAWKARIDKLTKNQPLLQIHTVVAFSGALESDLTIPALHFEDPKTGTLDTKLLQAHLTTSANASATKGGKYTTKSPGFELQTRAPDGTSLTVKVGTLQAQAELLPKSEETLWFGPSKTTGRVDSMELLATAGTGLPIKPVQAVFSQLRFDGDSKLDAGLFSSTTRMSATGIVNQVPVDKVEVAGSMKRLHAETYQRLVQKLIKTVFTCDSAAQQAAFQGGFLDEQKDIAALLVHNPEYALDKLAVDLKGKRAELNYSFGVQGATADDLSVPLPALLLGKGVVRIGARVHAALIAQAVKQLGTFDPAAAAAAGLPAGATGAGQADPTLAFVDGMVDQFAQLGYLERDGEMIKSSASYESGQVLVNGKPMALPDFGSLGK